MQKKIITPKHIMLNKTNKSRLGTPTKQKKSIPCKRCGLDCSGSKGMLKKNGKRYAICDECKKDYD